MLASIGPTSSRYWKCLMAQHPASAQHWPALAQRWACAIISCHSINLNIVIDVTHGTNLISCFDNVLLFLFIQCKHCLKKLSSIIMMLKRHDSALDGEPKSSLMGKHNGVGFVEILSCHRCYNVLSLVTLTLSRICQVMSGMNGWLLRTSCHLST